MTGLNVDQDKIMEIACIVTDTELNIVAEGPEIIINQTKEALDNMNEWCIKQHGKVKSEIKFHSSCSMESFSIQTGLTEACLKSQTSLEQAENSIMDFLRAHVTPNCSPLAGNSVYMDRFFLIKYMPKVHDYLHYRIVDVSTIKELCRRWNTPVYKSVPKKEFGHRALCDIKESIDELRYYKNAFFKTS